MDNKREESFGTGNRYIKAVDNIFSAENKDNNKKFIRNMISESVIYFFVGLVGAVLGGSLYIDLGLEVKDVVPLIAVFGAWSVSILVSENSKENEINKHREKWRTDLRIIYSEFSSAINTLSKKIFDGVSKENKTIVDSFNIAALNLRNCKEEVKEIERIYNLLSLYLLSKNENSAENKLFFKTYEVVDKIRVSDKEISLKHSELLKFSLTVEEKISEANFLLAKIDEATSDSLVDLNYCVKVYLDREWVRINEGYYGKSLKKTILVSVIFFLLAILSSFVVIQILKTIVENN